MFSRVVKSLKQSTVTVRSIETIPARIPASLGSIGTRGCLLMTDLSMNHPTATRAFRNLTVFRMHFELNGAAHSYGMDTPAQLRNIPSLLQQMPNLEVLELGAGRSFYLDEQHTIAAVSKFNFSRVFRSLIDYRLQFPKLQELKLQGGIVCVFDVIIFLIRHQKTIRKMQLIELAVFHLQWDHMLRFLANDNQYMRRFLTNPNENLPQFNALEQVKIENLLEWPHLPSAAFVPNAKPWQVSIFKGSTPPQAPVSAISPDLMTGLLDVNNGDRKLAEELRRWLANCVYHLRNLVELAVTVTKRSG
ncbi:hypothetical protein EJ08DRAFT_375599 [Tothia fuscella]|uniref:Uncharacterized protein n=1 Tax=Tothia fuscella TaxID=1048955 RepID=A0A9P4NLJ6_9PEZI|nr:hypothetical protein EJ08DRAFT_375599 [Tothia fuscella]